MLRRLIDAEKQPRKDDLKTEENTFGSRDRCIDHIGKPTKIMDMDKTYVTNNCIAAREEGKSFFKLPFACGRAVYLEIRGVKYGKSK